MRCEKPALREKIENNLLALFIHTSSYQTISLKLECLRAVGASHPESRWHGPSLAIGSNCRTSSSARYERCIPIWAAWGPSPCFEACVYLLRFPELRDRDAGSDCPCGTPGHIPTRVRARLQRFARTGVLQNCVCSGRDRRRCCTTTRSKWFPLFVGNSIFRKKDCATF